MFIELMVLAIWEYVLIRSLNLDIHFSISHSDIWNWLSQFVTLILHFMHQNITIFCVSSVPFCQFVSQNACILTARELQALPYLKEEGKGKRSYLALSCDVAPFTF